MRTRTLTILSNTWGLLGLLFALGVLGMLGREVVQLRHEVDLLACIAFVDTIKSTWELGQEVPDNVLKAYTTRCGELPIRLGVSL